MTPPDIKRRKFLRNTALAAGSVTLLPALQGCEKFYPLTLEGKKGFNEGVASFDPTATSVIIWTRFNPGDKSFKSREVTWEVSTDQSFSGGLRTGKVNAAPENDYTVMIDVENLQPNTSYYYRFTSKKGKVVSVTGETKTLPMNMNRAALAVVSCSNYQSGLFNVYGAIAESDVDVVVHLGDYIYEYGIGEFGTNENTAALGLEHEPATETIKLNEYRIRYRQYRQEEQLKRLHQKKAFICVWDDHEYANDAYDDGAENHDASEGSWEIRKLAARKAWDEYLPARTHGKRDIYRNFQFGNLVNLIMLDTRITGRTKQLNYADYFGTGDFDAVAFEEDWLNPARTILGLPQRGWLISQLASNSAEFQVLGSQVLMGKMLIPAELLPLISQLAVAPSPDLLALYTQTVQELSSLKDRFLVNDPNLTEEDIARITTVLPYNLDAWDGYPLEREAILAAAQGKKLVSLAGDTHNAWYSNLTNFSGQKVGEEFATPSVSSPGFEALFGTDPALLEGFENSTILLVDDLKYLDASNRGYLYMEFTPGNINAEWRYVETIASFNPTTFVGFSTQSSLSS